MRNDLTPDPADPTARPTRVGHTLGRTWYLQTGPHPSSDDYCIALFPTPELADAANHAWNTAYGHTPTPDPHQTTVWTPVAEHLAAAIVHLTTTDNPTPAAMQDALLHWFRTTIHAIAIYAHLHPHLTPDQVDARARHAYSHQVATADAILKK